jgi:dipeptidase
MSCTESTYGNERTLAFDPLVKDGLDEDCMQTVVLPYIDSARDGVKRLGSLIKNMVLLLETQFYLVIKMKYGTWKLLLVTTGLLNVFQMIVMQQLVTE